MLEVLDGDGDAVERSDRLSPADPLLRRPRGRYRVLRRRQGHGIELGLGPLDVTQDCLHHIAGRERATAIRDIEIDCAEVFDVDVGHEPPEIPASKIESMSGHADTLS